MTSSQAYERVFYFFTNNVTCNSRASVIYDSRYFLRNVFHKRVDTPSESTRKYEHASLYLQLIMSPPNQALPSSQEGRILLAIQAVKLGQFQTLKAAATSYDVPRITLYNRINGMTSRRDSIPNSRKLTPEEESALIQYIVDLDSSGFPPRPQSIQEMANLFLTDRGASPVGKNWTSNFITQHPGIKTKFSRKYNYKRAQCEDPVIIMAWFELVRITIAKWRILEMDIFNFDEAGFMMGIIAIAKVVTSTERRNRPKTKQSGNREWITIIQGINSYGWAIPPYINPKGKSHLRAWYKEGLPKDWRTDPTENGWTTNDTGFRWIQHFNQHTKSCTVGKYRLLILDSHESHLSAQFQQYCKDNNIITLCMPGHSSHLLQPLDVGCFSPLRTAYSKQIEGLVRLRIHHITKLEFLPAFKEAFKAAFTEQNIKAGFRATGLVPYDPQNVLSHLDLRLKTPTPPPIEEEEEEEYWTSKTPQNAKELENQTTHLKSRIGRHQNSSLTSINEAFDQLVKGAQIMVHSATLLKAEVKALQEANEVKKRRERKRKRRIYQGGSLTIEEGEELIQSTRIQEEEVNEATRAQGFEKRRRRCGLCNRVGHNARTCEQAKDLIEEE